MDLNSKDIKEFEDKDMCSKCGGMCCKNSGCNYLPNDFSNMNFDYLKSRLDEENISITAIFNFFCNNKKEVVSANPILHLRVRNVGKGIIDLFSKKTSCSVLTETGCPYTLEKRPSGGVYLIPKKAGCINIYPEKNQIEDWTKHQKVLQKLVRYYSNNSVEEQVKQEIINTTADMYLELKVLNGNVNKASQEIRNILITLNYLSSLYKKEIEIGQKTGEENYKKMILK